MNRFTYFLLPLLAAGFLSAATNAYIGHFAGTHVDVIDTATNMLLAPITVGSTPEFNTLTPDGTRLFVANAGNNTVTVIDTSTNMIVMGGTAITVGNTPQYLSASPDGSMVYICCSGASALSYINVDTLATGTIPTGAGPNFVGFSTDGTKGYTCDRTGNSVTVFSVPGNSHIATITVNIGLLPSAMVFTPDGNKAYVTNNDPMPPGKVSVIDLSMNTATYITMSIGTAPSGLAISPNGDKVIVANNGSNDFSIIDTGTNIASGPFPAGMQPFSVTFSPDGAKAFISNFMSNFITVYDVGTMMTSSLITPAPAAYMNLTPDGTKLFAPLFSMAGNVEVIALPSLAQTTVMGLSAFPLWPGIVGVPRSLQPPSNLAGSKSQNIFFVYTDLINVLSWDKPTGSAPVSYRIYRDASLQNLAGTVSASDPLVFEDHNIPKHQTRTYYVVSVNGSGSLSSPASVTIVR